MSKINVLVERCDKIMALLVYGLALLMPFSSAVCELFYALLLICYFLKKSLLFKRKNTSVTILSVLRHYSPNIGYLKRPVFLFLLVGVVSVLFSQIPQRSFQNFFFEFSQNILLMCFVAEVLNSKKRVLIVAQTFLIAMIFVILNSVWQLCNGEGFILGREMTQGFRLTSSFKHTNDFGGYLIISVSFAVALLLAPFGNKCQRSFFSFRKLFNSIKDRIFLTILMLMGLWSLTLTYSRGAWGGYGVAMAVMALLLWSRKTILTLLVVSAFFVISVPLMHQNRNVSFTSDSFRQDQIMRDEYRSDLSQDKGDGSLDGSYKKPIFGASGRIGFWKEGLGMLSTNPVFGIGLNTYTELAKIQKFPHNSFLRLLVEIGVVGFTAFLYLLGAIFFKGFWRLFRMDDVQLKYIGIGVFSGLIGFLAQSFVDTNFYSIQLATLMWYFMGVLIAIFQISEGNSAITSN